MPGTESVQITGPSGDRYDEILTPQAIDLIAALHAELAPRRFEALAARRRRQAELSRGAMLDFLPETAGIREDSSWRVAAPAPGLVDRRVEITGPTDKKMTINALNSGRQRVAGRLRGRQHPAVGQHDHRPAQPEGRAGPDHRLPLRRRQGLRAAPGRRAGHDRGPAARLAPGREAHPGRRDARVRQPGGLRAVHGDLRAAPAGQGQGPLLLPGQEREPPGGAALERSVPPGPGLPRHPARHDPGHGADRDDPGRVRDGGDPLRAAGALGRAERGPLGLPVQRDQEVPHPGPGVRPARAQLGHDDRPVHARLYRAAGQDLPPARRARDGRHGRVHPQPARPRGQREGAGQGPRGQDARVGRRLRRLLGGAPGPGADLQGDLRRRPRLEPEPARQDSARTCTSPRRTCSR